MSLTTIAKKVVSFCEIPKELTKNHWINKYHQHSFVECHIDDEKDDKISEWLMKNYPELKDEESFFIHIDY